MRDIGDVRLAMDGAFDPTDKTRVVPPHTARRAVAYVATLTVVGAVSLLIGAYGLPGMSGVGQLDIFRFSIPLPEDQQLSSHTQPVVAVSPDGSQIVYAANDSLWLRSVDQWQVTRLPDTDHAEAPFFSADGQSVGFWADGVMAKISFGSGVAVPIVDLPSVPSGARWGADDVIVLGQPTRHHACTGGRRHG